MFGVKTQLTEERWSKKRSGGKGDQKKGQESNNRTWCASSEGTTMACRGGKWAFMRARRASKGSKGCESIVGGGGGCCCFNF